MAGEQLEYLDAGALGHQSPLSNSYQFLSFILIIKTVLSQIQVNGLQGKNWPWIILFVHCWGARSWNIYLRPTFLLEGGSFSNQRRQIMQPMKIPNVGYAIIDLAFLQCFEGKMQKVLTSNSSLEDPNSSRHWYLQKLSNSWKRSSSVSKSLN